MMVVRICRACRCTFVGGHHALYCPECRKERRKIYNARSVKRKKENESRQLGKLDLCDMCNKPYVVKSGTQRYCPECAPKAIAENSNAQRKAYYAANKEEINARRRIERKENRKRLHICEICGNSYIDLYNYGCCSPECTERKRIQMEERRKAIRNKKLPPDVPRLRRKIDWSIIDWQKSNAEISRETGIPMCTIWFARKRIMERQPKP